MNLCRFGAYKFIFHVFIFAFLQTFKSFLTGNLYCVLLFFVVVLSTSAMHTHLYYFFFFSGVQMYVYVYLYLVHSPFDALYFSLHHSLRLLLFSKSVLIVRFTRRTHAHSHSEAFANEFTVILDRLFI